MLLSAKEIPAGGRGEIQTELQLDRHTGEITKTVRVFTNDPEHPMVKLILKAEAY
ncbi:MAG: DUF1573 domain-containing protein [Spirochaetes bacterium]|nr:DUF1573 domain-containing protein [Spirochaetota bacterium]